MTDQDRLFNAHLSMNTALRAHNFISVKGIDGKAAFIKLAVQEYLLRHEPETLKLNKDYQDAVVKEDLDSFLDWKSK
jgi:hypothetical protein